MAILNISQLCGFMVDMWTSIISWFNTTIGNYAWSIILLTLVIKLIMTPLDFFNKKVTRKNTKMQEKIQPELAKLQAKYGDNKNLYNQKVAEVYKANNYNVVGSCLFMIVNLVLTLVIFISLFSGLNAMASKKIIEQYDTLHQTYQTAYAENYSTSNDEELAIAFANKNVEEKYLDIKKEYTWLWIDNVWKADMPTNSIPTFKEYLNIAREVTVDGKLVASNKLTDDQRTKLEAEYEMVMGPLSENVGKTNGYIILTVLILVTAFLSQWLMQRKQKMLSAGNPMASGKIMMFIMPLMLGFFALTYNSVFALYLLTSQIITLATTPLIDLILDSLDNRKTKNQNVVVTTYSRNYVEPKKKKKDKDTTNYDKFK